jgi:hypothetical protein
MDDIILENNCPDAATQIVIISLHIRMELFILTNLVNKHHKRYFRIQPWD